MNALKNPLLIDARLAAAFANNTTTGMIHVPPDWQYIYEASSQTQVVNRIPPGEQPRWITDRPPQTYPTNTVETGTYLETNGYTGTGGFRQQVTVRAGQRYVARALVTAFVVANEAAENVIALQTRISHMGGVCTSDWAYVPAGRYRQPFETLAPVIVADGNGDIVYDFVAAIRAPVVAVKVVIHALYLNEVKPTYGIAVRVQPFGSLPPAPSPPPVTPTPLPTDIPPPQPKEPRGCRPRIANFSRVRRS